MQMARGIRIAFHWTSDLSFGVLEKFVLTEDAPAYRQITERLRAAIATGELAPGTRLPPIKHLAEKWQTNYFTVQTALTPLENEGLIERTPRLGTFVAGSRSRLSCVGIYYGATFWSSPDTSYYQTLFSLLSQQLSDQFIKPHLWIDHRAIGSQERPWPPLLQMVKRREVQGIVAVMITPQDLEWLSRLRLPLGALTYVDHPSSVNLDFGDMIRKALQRFADLGCRSAGMLISQAQTLGKFPELFAEAAAALGVEVPAGGVVVIPEASSQRGFAAIETFLKLPRVPEGVFVFPDSICQGVLMGLLKHRVRVPEDLKVIMHANEEISIYSPLPVDRIVTRVEVVAASLISQVLRQAQGNPTHAIRLPMSLKVAASA